MNIFDFFPEAMILGALASFIAQIISEKRTNKKDTLENRITRYTDSLKEAAKLITEIEDEIDTRSKVVNKLQNDLNNYNKLVKLKKPEVEAVAQLLRVELKEEGNKSFWKGVLANFGFFILGVIVTIITGIYLK